MSGKSKDPDHTPAETPHYLGHRARLRERFCNAGPDALSDHELLEMALFAAIPREAGGDEKVKAPVYVAASAPTAESSLNEMLRDHSASPSMIGLSSARTACEFEGMEI
jgi:hypothetical protein